MAEGVAHHFSQILTVVEAQAGLLFEEREKPRGAEHLRQVLSETRRGGALIRQLLAVGGCEGIQLAAEDLNALVQGLEAMLRRLIGDRIALELDLTPDLPPVLADSRLVEHVIVNLILNARDALPQGGSIEIRTEKLWIENPGAQRQAKDLPGHFLRLTVRDNGCGMSAEVQQHLFEPFFTTREAHKAMGLGLATVYGAVHQHSGWIECVSQPDRGTEFNVFLPAAQLPQPVNSPHNPVIATGSRAKVLLVETDDQVRSLAQHILRREGYQVIEADSPATAAVLMEAQGKSVHLLLTDVSFPDGSTGRDLAEQLRQTVGGLKVVYTIGTLAAEEHDPARFEAGKLLLKPYTPDKLLQAIGSSLGRAVPQRT
jgi:CheY-like chemotaxis protein